MSKGLKQQLEDLRQWSTAAEGIFEAQRLQLENYARVALLESTSAVTEVDIPHKHVEYKVKMGGKAPKIPGGKPTLGVQLKMLVQWVRFVMGEEWSVAVKVGRKVLVDTRVG